MSASSSSTSGDSLSPAFHKGKREDFVRGEAGDKEE